MYRRRHNLALNRAHPLARGLRTFFAPDGEPVARDLASQRAAQHAGHTAAARELSPWGRCTRFSGSDSITFAGVPAFGAGRQTHVCLYRWTSGGSGQAVYSLGAASTNQGLFLTSTTSGTRFQADVYGVGGPTILSLTATNWHFAQVTFDGTTLAARVGTGSWQTSTPALNLAAGAMLGNRPDAVLPMNGRVVMAASWNRVLGDAELRLLLRDPFAPVRRAERTTAIFLPAAPPASPVVPLLVHHMRQQGMA